MRTLYDYARIMKNANYAKNNRIILEGLNNQPTKSWSGMKLTRFKQLSYTFCSKNICIWLINYIVLDHVEVNCVRNTRRNLYFVTPTTVWVVLKAPETKDVSSNTSFLVVRYLLSVWHFNNSLFDIYDLCRQWELCYKW